jgi:hypothetical protein
LCWPKFWCGESRHSELLSCSFISLMFLCIFFSCSFAWLSLSSFFEAFIYASS